MECWGCGESCPQTPKSQWVWRQRGSNQLGWTASAPAWLRTCNICRLGLQKKSHSGWMTTPNFHKASDWQVLVLPNRTLSLPAKSIVYNDMNVDQYCTQYLKKMQVHVNKIWYETKLDITSSSYLNLYSWANFCSTYGIYSRTYSIANCLIA